MASGPPCHAQPLGSRQLPRDRPASEGSSIGVMNSTLSLLTVQPDHEFGCPYPLDVISEVFAAFFSAFLLPLLCRPPGARERP